MAAESDQKIPRDWIRGNVLDLITLRKLALKQLFNRDRLIQFLDMKPRSSGHTGVNRLHKGARSLRP
jgi:hypothetical protein